MTVMINLADYMPKKHFLRFRTSETTPGQVHFVCEDCLQYLTIDRYTWVQMMFFGHKPDFSVIPEAWLNCKRKQEESK